MEHPIAGAVLWPDQRHLPCLLEDDFDRAQLERTVAPRGAHHHYPRHVQRTPDARFSLAVLDRVGRSRRQIFVVWNCRYLKQPLLARQAPSRFVRGQREDHTHPHVYRHRTLYVETRAYSLV